MAKRQTGTGTIFKRGTIYYLKVMINGKIKKISLKTKNKADAEKKADEMLKPLATATTQAHIANYVAESRNIIQKSILTIEDVWQAYLNVSTNDRPNSGKGTLSNYQCHWNQFSKWLNLNYPVIEYLNNSITEDIAREYRDYLFSLKIADSTFNYKLTALNLVFKHLQKQAGLNGNVWNCINRINNPKQQTKNRFSFEQAETLLDVFKGKKYLKHKEELEILFNIAIYSGLRLADCANLKWEHIIKFENGMAIRCKPQKTIRYNKTITAPIVEPLQKALAVAKGWMTSDYVLPMIQERYNRNPTGVKKDCIKVFKYSGHETTQENEQGNFSAFGFHSIRHAIFSHLCQRGMTIERLKAWSGDSEKTLLKYYLHADTEKMITDAQNTLTESIKTIKTVTPEQKIAKVLKVLSRKNKLTAADKYIISLLK